MDIPTKVSIIKESNAITLIDGGNGFGQVAMQSAMDFTIEKAKKYGISAAFVRNTNNIGFLSHYTIKTADLGMVGICTCNAAPSISPWGGIEPFLGTNPISIAFPSFNEKIFAFDLSVSTVARGKIRDASRLNKEIPIDWAFGPDGKPTKNPKDALKGCLVPIGGYKGVALAIAIDILSGLISGSKYGKQVTSFHNLDSPTGVGAFFLALNLENIMDKDQIGFLLNKYIKDYKNVEKSKGVSEILFPGEIELNCEIKSKIEGIEIDDLIVEDLNAMLKYFGNAKVLK
jgi:LDH2 family malate/lactate/ureidoglycolate dehydrogenase